MKDDVPDSSTANNGEQNENSETTFNRSNNTIFEGGANQKKDDGDLTLISEEDSKVH